MSLILRDYQEDAQSSIAQAFRDGHNAAFYVLPTGGGKSAIFTSIAKRMHEKGTRALVICHRKELVNQARRHFRQAGINSGVIMSNKPMSLVWHVQVASAQTLVKKLEHVARFFDPDLIIEDEGHHGINKTHQEIFAAFPRARILRVSATPWDMAGKGVGLKDRREKLIIGPDYQTLINRGYLVRPMVYSPPLPGGVGAELDAVRKDSKGELVTADQEKILDKPTITGCVIEHYKKLCGTKPAIIFCSTVKHATNVARQFCEAGVRAEMIDGAASDSERDRMLSSLADGRLSVLTTCDLIGEGVDVPAVYASIMLRRTESLVIFLQQAGRAGRPVYAPGFDLAAEEGRLAAIAASDKPYGLLIDHVGNVGRIINGQLVIKHGPPQMPREWTLGPRSKRRRRKKDEEEKIQSLRTCPQCWCTHEPQPVCPQCGWLYLQQQREGPKTVGGSLVLIGDGAPPPMTAKQLEEQRKQYRRERLRKARTLEDLLALEREFGYAHGWARKQMQFREQAAARHRQNYYENAR